MKRAKSRTRRVPVKGGFMPAIFAVLGLAGLVTSVVSAARKAPEAKEKLEQAESEKGEPLTTVEKVKAAAPVYAETAIFVLATGACIVVAGRCHYKAVAGGAMATSLATFYKTRLQETEKAVEDRFGAEQVYQIKEDVTEKEKAEALKKLDKVAPGKRKDMSLSQIRDWYFEDTHNGYFDVYEPYTKQWIKISRLTLTAAMLHLNRIMNIHGRAQLNEFVIALGGKRADRGAQIGWDYDNQEQCDAWDWNFSGPWVDPYVDVATDAQGNEYLAIYYDIEPIEPDDPKDDNFWKPVA